MFFKWDDFKRLERPVCYLAKPNKKYIGTIQTHDLSGDMKFNDISKINFKVYKYENSKETLHYDEIEVLKLVEVSYVGWFVITECVETGDGENAYKEVTVSSLEYELCAKILTSFGSLGVESDEQGGLDRYALYDILDPEHSILHIVIRKAPNWSIGHIDSEITTERRSFNNDSVNAYDFLTKDVSEAFECIFQFDTFSRTISAYKLDNIGDKTSIFLSYRNLIKQIEIKPNVQDIKTVMTVAGGDYEGNPLQIAGVNPSGNSIITNFSYYKPWMSKELREALETYETAYKNASDKYITALADLNTLYSERSDLLNRLPSTEHSTNWNEYGLSALQDEFDYWNTRLSASIQGGDSTSQAISQDKLYGTNGINNALLVRKSEYETKTVQITAQEEIISNLIVDIHDYVSSELYKELDTYIHETEFTDDTFVAYENMSDEEILQMKIDLLEHARNQLANMAMPACSFTVTPRNFVELPEFRRFAEQLSLGNLITIELQNGTLLELRLLKIHYNWDNPSDFELSFSNKSTLDDGWVRLAELQAEASSAANSLSINATGYNKAKNQTSIVNEYMKNILDMSNQKLANSKDSEFLIDGTGTKWRTWMPDKNDYSPKQMWGIGNGLFLTDDYWKTVKMAVGELTLENGTTAYGIVADLLIGKVIVGENFYMSNADNTMTFKEDGLTVTNGVNTVKINPTANEEVFAIKKGEDNVLHFDIDGNGHFAGEITAKGGTIGGFTINQDSLSGNGVISGGIITGASITAQNSYFTSATLENCTVAGTLKVPNSGIEVTSDLTNNAMKLSEGKLTTNGNIGIFNNDIYCNKLFVGSSVSGIDKETGNGINILDKFVTTEIQADSASSDSRLIKFANTTSAKECAVRKSYVDDEIAAVYVAISALSKKN